MTREVDEHIDAIAHDEIGERFGREDSDIALQIGGGAEA